MKKVYIYGLICPKTNEIKYVGKTIQTLQSRLKGHLSLNKNDMTYRANWIRLLKNENLKPNIILIEECTNENWEEREIYWIDFYSKQFNLTNYSKGGNGGHYVKISTKEKMSLVYKEKWNNPEYREKMSLMSKKLWDDKTHKEKMSEIKKEKWNNPEYREKMSLMSKKLWEDENYRITRLTNESKEKIRQARLNSELSDETKTKISIASKKLWAENKEKWSQSRPKKIVIIDDIEFESMEKASKFLGLDASTISRRVKSEKHPNYKLKN